MHFSARHSSGSHIFKLFEYFVKTSSKRSILYFSNTIFHSLLLIKFLIKFETVLLSKSKNNINLYTTIIWKIPIFSQIVQIK
ncbi:TPA: hypothetical protein DEG21_06125 [Patescibacteria group bacterium]|nr:hypothetical protein [Candidatus Gracilibacteria bacterium]